MTIKLSATIFIAGVHQPVGTSLTLGAAAEAELVNRGVADYVGDDPRRGGRVPVEWAPGNTALVDPVSGFDIPLSVLADQQRPLDVANHTGTIINDLTGGLGAGTAGKVEIIAGSAGYVSQLDSSPDKRYPNLLKMTGAGNSTVFYDLAFSAAGVAATVVDRTAQNLGLFIKAMPRADGEPFGSVKIILGQKDSTLNKPLYTATYYEVRLTVPADGVERFYTLFPDAFSVTNGTAGVINFDYGHAIGAASVRLPENAECNKPTRISTNIKAWGTTDVVYFSPFYYNVTGKKSYAVFRFDDNLDDRSAVASYKGITNPSFVTDYIPRLTSPNYPDANARCFPADSCGAGIAYQGRSTVKILNGSDYSWAELMKLYGFSGSTFVLCRHVGTDKFLSVAQLKTLQDTYGWLIGFQSYYNPVSYYQQGVKLLGPNGYNIIGTKYTSRATSAVPAVQAVETNSGHPTLKIINVGMSQASSQGSPVVFVAGADLPAKLNAGAVYWLKERAISTTTDDTIQNVSVHATEAESIAGTNSIDIVTGYTGTAANIVFRFGYAASGSGASTADHTGILADYQRGKEWFQQNGFGDGYKTYAPNQSGIDIYCEQAIAAFGEFSSIWELGGSQFFYSVPFASQAWQGVSITNTGGRPDTTYNTRDDIMSHENTSTDGASYAFACTVDTATDVITITSPPTWLVPQNGETVNLTATTMPGGLAASTLYYIVNASGFTFKLSLTKGGAAIDITSAGTALSANLQETRIRSYIRHRVAKGAVIQSLTHDVIGVLPIRQAVFYMDEVRFWADKGMVEIGTADVIANKIKASRYNSR